MQTILIVDDHSDIRRLLSITLRRQYNILEAEDGMSALSIVHQKKPDMVLLDVMMPGEINGLQVLRAIKDYPVTRDIIVAMLTARGQVADSEEARKLGANAYFVKPFSPMQVGAWVKDMFEKNATQ